MLTGPLAEQQTETAQRAGAALWCWQPPEELLAGALLEWQALPVQGQLEVGRAVPDSGA